MNHKLMGTILSLLMVTSIVTIGFASWSIVNVDAYEEITGDIQSENIIDVGRYLKMPKATPLKYNKEGFLGDDKLNSEIALNGYNLKVALAKEELKLNQIDVIIKLNYIDLVPSEMNIFNNIKVEVYHDNQLLTSTVSVPIKDVGIETTISILGDDMLLNEYSFDIKYKFKLDQSYFNNPDSPLCAKSQPVFKISSLLQIK